MNRNEQKWTEIDRNRQKSAQGIILQVKYYSIWKHLQTENLCLNFALKCIKHEKQRHMFPINEKTTNLGSKKKRSLKSNFQIQEDYRSHYSYTFKNC